MPGKSNRKSRRPPKYSPRDYAEFKDRNGYGPRPPKGSDGEPVSMSELKKSMDSMASDIAADFLRGVDF